MCSSAPWLAANTATATSPADPNATPIAAERAAINDRPRSNTNPLPVTTETGAPDPASWRTSADGRRVAAPRRRPLSARREDGQDEHGESEHDAAGDEHERIEVEAGVWFGATGEPERKQR